MFAAETRVWIEKHVGLPIIDFDEEGRRIVRAAPPVIALRPKWFATHYGLSEMWQADGSVWLDSAGQHRYEKLRDLPEGAVAYRRMAQFLGPVNLPVGRGHRDTLCPSAGKIGRLNGRAEWTSGCF